MWAKAVCALVALGGCTTGVTEVLIAVDTDLEVPAEIDRLRVDVTDHDGVLRRSEGPLASEAALPATVGVVERGGARGEMVAIVEGYLGDVLVLRRAASFVPVTGEIRVLRVELERACLGVSCSGDQTCARGSCRARQAGAGELLAYEGTPGRVFGGPDGGVREDAAVVDASLMDASSIDASLMDASSIDASRPDAGAVDAAACAGSSSCGLGAAACVCAPGCTCSLGCDDACAVDCTSATCVVDAAGGTSVSVECDASSCSVDASGRASVDVLCRNGATCDVRCRGSARCDVRCEGGSNCIVDCLGATTCPFATCEGMARSCPMQRNACNRTCP